ncbi:MAG TPA: hypothetical protein VFD58_19765 [Blastocatellia bacterium]|nr:hypothetical protein [Blastocatellia bacterium]
MHRILYQSNFCAECGNRPGRRRWWQHGYFCECCARRLGRRRAFWPMLFAVCVVLLGVTINTGRQETALERMTSLNTTTAPVVSARDATAMLKAAPAVPAPSPEYAVCGARTRKGTACRHRVKQPGQRCAQHQGMPSILK